MSGFRNSETTGRPKHVICRTSAKFLSLFLIKTSLAWGLKLPLILAELEKEPDHWFWALEAITGENPVSENDAGDMEASAKAWVKWGRQNGLLAK